MARTRTPEIMADAAHAIVCRPHATARATSSSTMRCSRRRASRTWGATAPSPARSRSPTCTSRPWCDVQRVGRGRPGGADPRIPGLLASGPLCSIRSRPGGHETPVPTLAGHRGGPSLAAGSTPSVAVLANDLAAQLDTGGVGAAHLVGNSLGGWIALELARRVRARSVVAFSPGGGWTTTRDLARVVRLISFGRATLIRHREQAAERSGAHAPVDWPSARPWNKASACRRARPPSSARHRGLRRV